MMKLAVLLVCFVVALSQVQAIRIFIQLEKESLEMYKSHITKRQANEGSCDDSVEVARSAIVLPGDLNQLNARVKFYRSANAKNNLDMFQDMTRVPGLDGKTVRDVFNTLRNGTCLPFFMGGTVRDQFLGIPPNDADVQVDCTIDTFYQVCIAAWGTSNCKVIEGSRRLGFVGNEEVDPGLQDVDVGSTDLTFFSPVSTLEYTVNAMVYDTNGNDVIIDLTGQGRDDACNKHIRIPSDDDSIASWKLWLTNTNASAVFRFWKLRTKRLTAFNSDTQVYIIEQAKLLANSVTNSFPKFYCLVVFAGSSYDIVTGTCAAVSSSVCERGQSKVTLYNTTFVEDLGSDWMEELGPSPTCRSSSKNLAISAHVMLLSIMFGYYYIHGASVIAV